MTRPPDDSLLFARPHRLQGRGTIHVAGTGTIRLRLDGRGTVEVAHLRETAFHFEGEGARRFPGPDRLVVSDARAVLRLEGAQLDVSVRSTRIDVELRGSFRIRLEGQGEWTTPAGARRGWVALAGRLETGSYGGAA